MECKETTRLDCALPHAGGGEKRRQKTGALPKGWRGCKQFPTSTSETLAILSLQHLPRCAVVQGMITVRYELMRPAQLRTAMEEGWPAVLPLGVLEYHGEHLPLGVDGLIVAECLARLEAEMDLVILPPFWYGAASYAVAGPEGTGSLQVDAEALVPVARQLFAALLRVGVRHLHVLIHHQTENFGAGMPTDLAFKLAARQAIFAYLERERGEGWWGRPEAADYYAQHATGDDPFNWIKAHPLLTPEAIRRYPFDHAGQGETSFMLELCPHTVDMGALGHGPWYTSTAAQASAELGAMGVDLVLDHLRQILNHSEGSTRPEAAGKD